MVIEEMTGGQHHVDETQRAEQLKGDANEQKLQQQTPFVRRQSSVLRYTTYTPKKLLHRPAQQSMHHHLKSINLSS